MTELDENKILQAVEAVETETKATSNRERWILLVVAAIIILLDQGSKSVVESTLALYTYYAPIPALENIFRISHVTNTGVAFGLFPDGNLLFTLVALIVAIVTLVALFVTDPIYQKVVIGAAVWYGLGLLWFALHARHKLVLAPEESFARSAHARQDDP